MKQKLKIPIGSSLQKAATCLTFAAVIAALVFTFSCSSDDDYEEPWVNKEHRTRAAMMTARSEAPSEQMVEEGSQVVTLDIKPKCSVELHWTEGYMTGSSSPKSTVTAESPAVLSPHSGEAYLDECILRWNPAANKIEGTINIHGNYVPNHTSKELSFRKKNIQVSAAVTPTFVNGDRQAVNDTIQAACEEHDAGFITTNGLSYK